MSFQPAKSRLSATVFLSFCAALVHAAPPARQASTLLPMIAAERAIEVEAGSIDWPSAVPGTLTVHACASCAAERYVTDAGTLYLARNSSVSAAEIQPLARASVHAPATVLIDVKTHVVTRVLLDVAAPVRRNP